MRSLCLAISILVLPAFFRAYIWYRCSWVSCVCVLSAPLILAGTKGDKTNLAYYLLSRYINESHTYKFNPGLNIDRI
uniref:Uncharacterized protein n=1 Tax=Candidatus Kentrum sp. TC TaxID=2126339 RepID=A0A450Z881_9GAMM|nr:MAG: hypothetical protein BECKTC1821D_GA0114238_10855 [Candidatus Kentron sp. TC]VFK62067.1 MAG: hypothetical protein BECKTC1821F_GA0114240_10686 [Candidatus Kentron sp. TC]